MPVEAMRPDQLVIMVAFLLLLLAVLLIVRRFRGRITSSIHGDKRMHHIEDLVLSGQERLHLVEIDGTSILVHAGKGHAASFLPLGPAKAETPKGGPTTTQKNSGKPANKAAPASKPSASDTKAANTPLSSAISEARKRNPLLRLGQ
jgi:flagellar biogenesis protein FliO